MHQFSSCISVFMNIVKLPWALLIWGMRNKKKSLMMNQVKIFYKPVLDIACKYVWSYINLPSKGCNRFEYFKDGQTPPKSVVYLPIRNWNINWTILASSNSEGFLQHVLV